MPFDSAVLDNFNRADGVLGANWTALFTGTPGTIVSNQLDPSVSSAWAASIFGPDSEGYFDVPTVDTTDQTLGIALRARNLGATPDFYLAMLALGTGVVQFARVDAGAFTFLGGNTTVTFVSGDSLGAAVEGAGDSVLLTAYRKPAAGAWAVLDTRTDTAAARIVTAGYIGFRVDTPSIWIADNFGGGTLSATLPAINSRVPMPMFAVPDQDRIMRISDRSGA